MDGGGLGTFPFCLLTFGIVVRSWEVMLKLAASQLSVHAVGNRSSEESGLQNPSYEDRESEFPPTKIVTARGACLLLLMYFTRFL